MTVGYLSQRSEQGLVNATLSIYIVFDSNVEKVFYSNCCRKAIIGDLCDIKSSKVNFNKSRYVDLNIVVPAKLANKMKL